MIDELMSNNDEFLIHVTLANTAACTSMPGSRPLVSTCRCGEVKKESCDMEACVCVEGLVITHTRFITCGSLQLNGPEMVCQTIETIYDVQ